MNKTKLPRTLPCPLCDLAFSTRAGLHRHVHQSHPGHENWKIGDRLGAAASNGATPTETKYKSTRTRCPECGQRGFTKAATFAAHRQKQHGVAGSSPAALYRKSVTGGKGKVQCPECPRKFGTTLALSVHRRHAHGIKGKHTKNKGRKAKRAAGGEALHITRSEVASLVQHARFCPVCATDMDLINHAIQLQK